MIAGTVHAGVVTTIRSGTPGSSAMDLYAGRPSTLGRFGFTGHTGPPKGLAMRLLRTVQPTLPTRSDAPMTATDPGVKMGASGLRRTLTKSCAGSMMTGVSDDGGGAMEAIVGSAPYKSVSGRTLLPRKPCRGRGDTK